MRLSLPPWCGSVLEATPPPPVRPRTVRALCSGLGLFFLLLSSTVKGHSRLEREAGASISDRPAAALQTVAPHASSGWDVSGPWGVLHLNRIRLVQRDEMLKELVVHPGNIWSFGHETWPAVDAFLNSLGLPAATRDTLADPTRRTIDLTYGENVIVVPDALRLSIPPDVRAQLYRHMASVGSSPAHQLPFFVPDDRAIDAARLSPGTARRLRQLLFVHDSRHRLADFDLVLAFAKDEAERVALRRLMLSESSLTVELTRASLADRESVIAYWSRPHSTSAQRWLRLFDRSPDMPAIDLAQILPALPRRLVNTYPDGESTPAEANCFWTALNFFRTQTYDALLPQFEGNIDPSAALALEELHRHYDRVDPPYRYGDVIAFSNRAKDDAMLIHTAVYLAGDVVLTKNGWGGSSPFSLSVLPEFIETYSWATDLEVQAFRPKPGSPALPLP